MEMQLGLYITVCMKIKLFSSIFAAIFCDGTFIHVTLLSKSVDFYIFSFNFAILISLNIYNHFDIKKLKCVFKSLQFVFILYTVHYGKPTGTCHLLIATSSYLLLQCWKTQERIEVGETTQPYLQTAYDMNNKM